MTPSDHGKLDIANTTECEFFGGPMDGLEMRIYKERDSYVFACNPREVITPKSCGMPVIQLPIYTRINDKRFDFVGYR